MTRVKGGQNTASTVSCQRPTAHFPFRSPKCVVIGRGSLHRSQLSASAVNTFQGQVTCYSIRTKSLPDVLGRARPTGLPLQSRGSPRLSNELPLNSVNSRLPTKNPSHPPPPSAISIYHPTGFPSNESLASSRIRRNFATVRIC